MKKFLTIFIWFSLCTNSFAQSDTITLNNINLSLSEGISFACDDKVNLEKLGPGVYNSNLLISNIDTLPSLSISFNIEPDNFKIESRVGYRHAWYMSETEGYHYFKNNELDTSLNHYTPWTQTNLNGTLVTLESFKKFSRELSGVTCEPTELKEVQEYFGEFANKYYEGYSKSSYPLVKFRNEIKITEYNKDKKSEVILTFIILIGEC